ncbi:lasso peptide biosynthesis protein [Trinickia symbiotica]|uniref:lasso peptide biosynthesis protein n=1 Tax=Trinickia symbiotica TaxID=863227 RepID=UPI0015E66928|nr:lasso peptide biosynthesis protein [Trinickia symbiotica]
MNSEQRHILLLHGLVRALLLERAIDDAYLTICKNVFPGAVLGNFPASPKTIDHHYLTRICDFIYELDGKEWSYASCYSASIVVQLISLVFGVDSEIIIGVKKQDQKMIGHAWVELSGVNRKQIITPGRIGINEFKVIKRLRPENAIQSWMEKRATLDAAVKS